MLEVILPLINESTIGSAFQSICTNELMVLMYELCLNLYTINFTVIFAGRGGMRL